jgi:predicted RNase H-like HicB family nuclease
MQALRRNAMRLMVNLIFDPEYKGYVADVPELPGCMSQGKTIEQALKNVKEAIALYLETVPRKRRSASKPTLVTTVEV